MTSNSNVPIEVKTFLNIILKYSSRVYRVWKSYYTDTLSTLYDGLHMKVHLGSSYMVFSQPFSVVDRYDVVQECTYTLGQLSWYYYRNGSILYHILRYLGILKFEFCFFNYLLTGRDQQISWRKRGHPYPTGYEGRCSCKRTCACWWHHRRGAAQPGPAHCRCGRSCKCR